MGCSPDMPLANALGHGVLGTLASRPQTGRRGRRRSMRAGRKRSQDAVPAQTARWGEICQQPPSNRPQTAEERRLRGVKNISTPSLPSLYQELTNSARASAFIGVVPGAAVESRSASHESSIVHFQTSITRILLQDTSGTRAPVHAWAFTRRGRGGDAKGGARPSGAIGIIRAGRRGMRVSREQSWNRSI